MSFMKYSIQTLKENFQGVYRLFSGSVNFKVVSTKLDNKEHKKCTNYAVTIQFRHQFTFKRIKTYFYSI